MIQRAMIFRWLLPTASLCGATVSAIALTAERPRTLVTEPRLFPPRQDTTVGAHIGASGVIESASGDIAIATSVTGLVARVFVGVGDEVRAGQPLLEIDTRALAADVAQRESDVSVAMSAIDVAEATVAEAAAQRSDRKAQATRAAALREAKAISDELADSLEAAANVAEAQFARAVAQARQAQASASRARSALRAAQVALELATVRSPIDGTVLRVDVEPGELAHGGATQPLMLLGQNRPLYIRADIDEADVPRLATAQPASFSLRGDPTARGMAAFVRTDLALVPKRNLAGVSGERVDTRVLQVIYRVDDLNAPAYVGQQVDLVVPALR